MRRQKLARKYIRTNQTHRTDKNNDCKNQEEQQQQQRCTERLIKRIHLAHKVRVFAPELTRNKAALSSV